MYMRTIYKYPLQITDEQIVNIPGDPEILCAQMQIGTLYVWAEIESNADPRPITIRIVKTGDPIDKQESLKYISSVEEGLSVFHVFRKF